jgi:hypothetical protein
MKLACFTMMRNESAILEPFLDQVGTFFDHTVILDHGSTDGSADIVRKRNKGNLELARLQASGYPQSEVATFFARRIYQRHAPDFTFFLDCDEFLPFSSRSDLEAFLADKKGFDVLRLHWLNLAPTSFEGTDIFRQLVRAPAVSPIPKIIVSAALFHRGGDWSIHQGYHGVHAPKVEQLRIFDIEDRPLYHIPIQSRSQFMFKLAAGSSRLRREKTNLKKRQGFHWVELAKEAVLRPLPDSELRAVALGYPDRLRTADSSSDLLTFDFPYVQSAYRETADYFTGQIRGLMLTMEDTPVPSGSAYSIIDENGEIMTTSHAERKTSAVGKSTSVPAQILAGTEPAELYASLIEPLFNLPAKLPVTAWGGHIPFLFLLFRALQPKTYVELGVHNGASLIAASTAASTYNLQTHLTGVDTWQGDAHAGYYQGDQLYQELRTYLSATFPNAHLERCLFSEAVGNFNPGSIDILHIDGLHSYDAVKEDFSTWFDRVSPSGVILFHDISVFDRGFGVHRLWAELKEKFTTLEFHHSAGLGALLMNPDHPGLGPILSLAKDPVSWRLYQSLVADIANALPERMEAFKPYTLKNNVSDLQRKFDDAQRRADEAHRTARETQQQLASVFSSTSWRLTSPVRALKRIVGGS